MIAIASGSWKPCPAGSGVGRWTLRPVAPSTGDERMKSSVPRAISAESARENVSSSVASSASSSSGGSGATFDVPVAYVSSDGSSAGAGSTLNSGSPASGGTTESGGRAAVGGGVAAAGGVGGFAPAPPSLNSGLMSDAIETFSMLPPSVVGRDITTDSPGAAGVLAAGGAFAAGGVLAAGGGGVGA